MEADDDHAVRLDIWLWRARVLKTRSACAKLITSKGVRITRGGYLQRVTKPHFKVRPGDHLTFMRAQELINIIVYAPGTRRGPASEAQALYGPADKP